MFGIVRVDPVTIAGVVVACAAVATLYGAAERRRRDRQREDTRNADRTYGWRDSATGRWHPGTNDYVLGWVDDDGEPHPGDHEVLRRDHELLRQHLDDRTLHRGGGPP